MCILALSLTLLLCSALAHAYEDQALEDDDFAEFEQFEVDDETADGDFSEEDVPVLKPKSSSNKEQFEANNDIDDEIIIEDEDNEFEHFQDPEEFEGFQDTAPKSSEQPKITISKVPITVRPRWDAYWLEGILCCLLASYALAYAVGRAKNTSIATNFLKLHKPLLDDNFTLVGESISLCSVCLSLSQMLEEIRCCPLAPYEVGRAKNTSIATNFLKLHKPLLDDNFTLVGETGLDVVAAPGSDRGWRREAEHCFTMWCSGRQCCEGMLLTLKLIKRQDLVNVLLGVVRPTPDTLLIRVELGKDDSDPYVLCVAQKKIATRLAKEMQDLSMFCPEKRPGDKHGLPSALSVLSECAEATAGLLDARVTAALEQYHKNVQFIHVSDRYCGPKQMEETVATKPPDTERAMLVGLALGPDGGGEEVRPLLLLVFYLLDKIKRLRLSKEALSKCEKRRQKAAEAWVKGTHAARQEQAALRREEKRKQEKEKILAEDDPEKQRRWELKEQKRQQKRKAPKMKQLKVKAL